MAKSRSSLCGIDGSVGVKGGVLLSRILFMFSPSWSICVEDMMASAWKKLGSGGVKWMCFRDR